MQIIADELKEVAEKYADPRRTEIDVMGGGDIDLEDLIEDEHVVVTITHQGLVKRTSIDEYRAQNRGGTGHRGTGTRDEDFVEHLFTASAHDYLLFFTDHGQCYWLRVYNVPEGSRTGKGRSVRNLVRIDADDRVRAVLAIKKEDFRDDEFLESHFVLMATRQGLVKKSALAAFKRPLVSGIIAIDIVDGDELIEAHLTDGDTEILFGSSEGQAIRFHESDVRSMGRKSRGVRGMNLPEGAHVIGMIAVRRDGAQVLTISQNGYGKRTDLDEYRIQTRGGKGILTQKTTSKTGPLVALKSVLDGDQLMIATEAGIMIRMAVGDISEYGRNTQGVRVLTLKANDAIADVARVVIEDDEAAAIEATEAGMEAVPPQAAPLDDA